MNKLISTLVLGFALVVVPTEGALAEGASGLSGQRAGQVTRLSRELQRHRHAPKRHRRHRGQRIESVPELDGGSAGAALILMLGGLVVLNERRRILQPVA